MKIKEIILLLQSKFNVSFKKDKFPYRKIQTKEDILSAKNYFQEKRGYFFLSEMSKSSKKGIYIYLAIILSQNSSDFLMKIASKLIKSRENNRIFLFQTYNTKMASGTKLIAMIEIEGKEEEEIWEAYEQLNSLFKEYQSILNEITDSFFRR
jgi:hypothetical protein